MRTADYAALAPTNGLQIDPKNPPDVGDMLVWNGANYVPGTISGMANGSAVALIITPSVMPD